MFRPAPEPVFWVRAVPLHVLPRGWSAGGRASCPVCRSVVLTACGLHASVRMAAPPHPPLPNLKREFLERRQHSVCPRLSWSTQRGAGGGKPSVRLSEPSLRAHQCTFAEDKLLADGSVLGTCSLPCRKHTVGRRTVSEGFLVWHGGSRLCDKRKCPELTAAEGSSSEWGWGPRHFWLLTSTREQQVHGQLLGLRADVSNPSGQEKSTLAPPQVTDSLTSVNETGQLN